MSRMMTWLSVAVAALTLCLMTSHVVTEDGHDLVLKQPWTSRIIPALRTADDVETLGGKLYCISKPSACRLGGKLSGESSALSVESTEADV